ncbi:MAG: hypothetical protein AB3N22_00960, partial [Ruegeria sp.]
LRFGSQVSPNQHNIYPESLEIVMARQKDSSPRIMIRVSLLPERVVSTANKVGGAFTRRNRNKAV